jgi:multiple sugar transport system substrate-binding protein
MTSKISRRSVLAGATGLAAATALFGSRGALAQETQDLVYLGWSQTEAGSKDFLEKTFADFQAANPQIKLETIGVPYGQFETTLLLRKRSDQRLDLAQVSDRALAPFVAAGGLADVDEVFGADAIDAKFDAAAMKMAEVGGKRYGLPWISGTIGLVGNANVLEAAGISENPATMDQLLEALRAIKKAKPDSSPFGLSTKAPALAQFESQLIFWNFGADIIQPDGTVVVDSPEAREALSYLANLVKEGLIIPGNDRFDFRKLYAQNLVGYYCDQPLVRGFARDLSGQGEAFDKFILPMPMPVGKEGLDPVNLIGGHVLVFPDYGAAEPTADGPAKKLADYLTSTDVQIGYYRATANFPTTKEAIAALKDDSFFVAWNEANDNSRVDGLGPFLNAGDLRVIVGEEVIAAMLGQKTADDAIATMAERLKGAGPKPA